MLSPQKMKVPCFYLFHYTRGRDKAGHSDGALAIWSGSWGLEDEGGGDLIDHFAVLLAGAAGLIQDLMGFPTGEPLVPEVNGEAGEFTQFGGEGLGFGGLGALVPGEVDRVSDDDADDGKSFCQAGEGAQVIAAVVLALEGEDRLRCDSQLVRDSYAYAAVAYVETEIAGMGSGFQL